MEIAETVLEEVEWSASRTGLINPVAVFEPVELEGTTVSRASVHNVSIVEQLALGVGDHIQVYKANMIISTDCGKYDTKLGRYLFRKNVRCVIVHSPFMKKME